MVRFSYYKTANRTALLLAVRCNYALLQAVLVNIPNAHCSYFLEAKLVAHALEKERTQIV